MSRIILTSDYSTFYSLPPLPSRLLPFYRKAKYPPYGLRKVEAITQGEIVPPEKLPKTNEGVIGIYVNDPLGLSEVAQGLRRIFGDEPNYVSSFRAFVEKIKALKERGRKIKLIVGGPGAWELTKRDWIDHVLLGEAEKTLPEVIKKIEEEELPKVIYGESADKFYPIRSPSAMAEVEVMRKDKRIPLDVVKKELEIQSKSHGYVNLISQDLFSYGNGLIDLLKLSSSYGKVIFSNISVISSLTVDLGKIKEILRLNENNWRSPVLSSKPGSCIYKVEKEVLVELNKNFIYPMIYTDSYNVYNLMNYKSIIIPIPSSEDEGIYKVLYDVWLYDKKIVKIPFSSVIDYVLRKNLETKGEYLRKLRLNAPFFMFKLLSLLARSIFF